MPTDDAPAPAADPTTDDATVAADEIELARTALQTGTFDALPEPDRRRVGRALRDVRVARDTGAEFERARTLGERMADRIATFGGSWTFIGLFFAFMVFWSVLNTEILGPRQAFDPYPYIFLNLMLSMLAALQAPVIMMSQNRQAARDRLDARHDYEVNLKAELEIRALHDRLDLLARELQALRVAGDASGDPVGEATIAAAAPVRDPVAPPRTAPPAELPAADGEWLAMHVVELRHLLETQGAILAELAARLPPAAR